jgi:hypothetical protein
MANKPYLLSPEKIKELIKTYPNLLDLGKAIAEEQHDQDMKDMQKLLSDFKQIQDLERKATVEKMRSNIQNKCWIVTEEFIGGDMTARYKIMGEVESFIEKILLGGFAPKPICKACDGSGLSTYDCACHGGGGATVECSPCPVCKGTGVEPENTGGSQG